MPKSLAIRHADALALAVARPIERLSGVARFAVAALTASTRGMLRLFGQKDKHRSAFHTLEDLRAVVLEAEQQGVIDGAILHRVFGVSETPVKQAMVPRHRIFALEADTPPSEVERLVVESGFSRIPVYEGSPAP